MSDIFDENEINNTLYSFDFSFLLNLLRIELLVIEQNFLSLKKYIYSIINLSTLPCFFFFFLICFMIELDLYDFRAIYRWITIKNLNVMQFDSQLDSNTPMGLLRGIKYGTESYHVLFKRLCRWLLLLDNCYIFDPILEKIINFQLVNFDRI